MDEDLFSTSNQDLDGQPLAFRMRPRTIDEYIGQEHIIGKGRLLRRAIQADLLSSVIFYGPPGTGKTTLARVIANTTKSHFATLNAVLSGVKELRYEIDQAKSRLDHYGKRTILFVDEVHRWNKSQQDALLPWVENGTIVLIGATTENPYFEVNAALVSRSRVFQLVKLTEDDLMRVAKQALVDKERGYGKYDVSFEDGALEHLVHVAGGDARSLLNALQLAVETTPEQFPPKAGEKIYISKQSAEESIQQKVVLYDKEGDYHFDVISAFIKSIRGSDPDATLYWMARMIAAGEDPRFIFRRMLISACEDIGLADPLAVQVVEADAAAFDRIGLPEGRFQLTHAALYLATAKKSNSALAFFDALHDVENEKQAEVPNHLRDASRDSKAFGHGDGYMYPHAYKDHWVAQQYLPTGMQGKIYYKPSNQGYESEIQSEVERKREAQLESVSEDAYAENLTYSPSDKAKERWLQRTSNQGSKLLLEIRDKLFYGAKIKRSDNILILNASHGLLLCEAKKHHPEGHSVAQVRKESEKEYIDHYKSNLDKLNQPIILCQDAKAALKNYETDMQFEFIFAKNLFTRLYEEKETLSLLNERIIENGEIRLCESIPSDSSALSDFVTDSKLKQALIKAEETILHGNDNPMTNWGKEDMLSFFKDTFEEVESENLIQTEERFIDDASLDLWWNRSYLPVLVKQGINTIGLEEKLKHELSGKNVNWKHSVLIISLRHSKLKQNIEKPNPEVWKEVHEKTSSNRG